MKRYGVNPVVSLREESGGALLYNPDLDEVVLINVTGRMIWEAISQAQTPEEIVAYIEANTREAENVLADVESFIESLLSDFVILYEETATK